MEYEKSLKSSSFYFVGFVLCIVLIFPIIWMFSGSFKAPQELYAPDIRLIPHVPTFANYREAFGEWPVSAWLFNSAVIAVGITTGQLLTSLLAAYGFAQYNFRGKDVLFIAVIGTMIVPFAVTMIPNYVLISSLGGKNTHWGVIVPYLATGFGIFLVRQHFMSIPQELFDAAKIDGASSWYSLWHIAVPLSRGLIIALAVYLALNAWNVFFWPLLILTESKMQTVSVGLISFTDVDFGFSWGVLMATASVFAIPPLIFYAIGQKHIMKSFLISGLKR